jgi:hypothetical protein
MQKTQAAFDHIAARGHAAKETPPSKRSSQQKEDVSNLRRLFGTGVTVSKGGRGGGRRTPFDK